LAQDRDWILLVSSVLHQFNVLLASEKSRNGYK